MAIYTIGGLSIGERIRYAVSDVDAKIFSDTELNIYIEDALREYAHYRPAFKSLTITTVANQQDYTLSDTDLIEITWHNWATARIPSLPDIPAYLPWMASEDPAEPVLYLLSQQHVQTIDKAVGGKIVRLPNDKLRLFPTPSGIDAVTVEYHAYHTRTANDYTTVDKNDVEIVVWLVAALCYDTLAADYSRRLNYVEGQTEINVEASQRAIRRQASYYRSRSMNRLAVSIVGRT